MYAFKFTLKIAVSFVLKSYPGGCQPPKRFVIFKENLPNGNLMMSFLLMEYIHMYKGFPSSKICIYRRYMHAILWQTIGLLLAKNLIYAHVLVYAYAIIVQLRNPCEIQGTSILISYLSIWDIRSILCLLVVWRRSRQGTNRHYID